MSAGVSVLTLAKGRHAHLAQLIQGLQRSNIKPRELIVVDMSGDWGAPDGAGFPIRVISMKSSGLPLAAARNAAAAAATSKDLLFLDVDCVPRSDLLGRTSEHLFYGPRIVCAEVRYLVEKDSVDDWNEHTLWAAAQPHPVRSFPSIGFRLEPNPGLFWSLLFGIRRSLFLDLGGFDEAFSGYGAEDTDFGFRADAAGLPLYFVGGGGALHQHHPVFDPPLQHFDDIVHNAAIFRGRWPTWPMLGWLQQFHARGLIRLSDSAIEVVRRPTTSEVDAARVDRPF